MTQKEINEEVEKEVKRLKKTIFCKIDAVAIGRAETDYIAVIHKRIDKTSWAETLIVADSQTVMLETIKILMRSGRGR